MSDLEILRRINKKLGLTFGERDLEEVRQPSFTRKAVYALDDRKNVIALKIGEFEISEIPIEIEELRHLKYLAFSNTRLIADLLPLKNLRLLRKLDLRNNRITDISDLAGLKKLNNLNLSNNLIDNVLSLRELKQLKILDLSVSHRLSASCD